MLARCGTCRGAPAAIRPINGAPPQRLIDSRAVRASRLPDCGPSDAIDDVVAGAVSTRRRAGRDARSGRARRNPLVVRAWRSDRAVLPGSVPPVGNRAVGGSGQPGRWSMSRLGCSLSPAAPRSSSGGGRVEEVSSTRWSGCRRAHRRFVATLAERFLGLLTDVAEPAKRTRDSGHCCWTFGVPRGAGAYGYPMELLVPQAGLGLRLGWEVTAGRRAMIATRYRTWATVRVIDGRIEDRSTAASRTGPTPLSPGRWTRAPWST